MTEPRHNPNPFKELLPKPWVMGFMLIFLGLLFWRLFTYVPEDKPVRENTPVQKMVPSQSDPVDESL